MTRQQTASAPTSKAIWPLEPLNFFTADMQAGIGHFLGVFLLAHGRESGLIGFEGGRNARQLPKQRHEPRARRPDGATALAHIGGFHLTVGNGSRSEGTLLLSLPRGRHGETQIGCLDRRRRQLGSRTSDIRRASNARVFAPRPSVPGAV